MYINDRVVVEDYLPEECEHEFPGRVISTSLQPGEYYVLGDNRPVSKDSRSFGAIDEETIIGKAVLRFWPLSRFGLLK